MTAMAILEKPELATGAARRTIGIVVAKQLFAGMLTDGKLDGEIKVFPERMDGDGEESPLGEYPTEALVEAVCRLTTDVCTQFSDSIAAVGVTLPGLVRNGVVEESPNLPQLKGARIAEMLSAKLNSHGLHTQVTVSNDGDATAAGLAAMHDKLDQRVRVWTLGNGIGYGVYPPLEGPWEGGHTVVTLDERENYCGCGGKGHLEGIMGHRAMRLRFLDMEPEEVFAAATRKQSPDPRCVEFRNLWHRALAAATASSIHNSGAGRFFLTGYNVRFLDLNLLREYMHDMVKMSPLQSYQLEIVEDDQSIRVIGAAVLAEQGVLAR